MILSALLNNELPQDSQPTQLMPMPLHILCIDIVLQGLLDIVEQDILRDVVPDALHDFLIHMPGIGRVLVLALAHEDPHFLAEVVCTFDDFAIERLKLLTLHAPPIKQACIRL